MTRIADSKPTDTTFEVLTHQLRREILCLLDDAEEAPTDEEIIEEIATLYNASESEVAIALQHVHLPKLRETEFLDYDDRNGDIQYRGSEVIGVLRDNNLIECKTCSDDGSSSGC